MAYTARELISRSYYLSGIVARDFEVSSLDQITDGLQLLNALLATKTANPRLIPYFAKYEFNTIKGTQEYFINNLIEVETFTFNLNTVRFPMDNQSRRQFFGSARVDGIQSLPFSGHFEREKGGSRMYLYFVPDQEYPIKIWGKFSLASVTLDQDLSLTLDAYYIEYLKYALAKKICADNTISMPIETRQQLDEYEEMIADISPIDFTNVKKSTLSSGSSITWPHVNISPGWDP